MLNIYIIVSLTLQNISKYPDTAILERELLIDPLPHQGNFVYYGFLKLHYDAKWHMLALWQLGSYRVTSMYLYIHTSTLTYNSF